MRIVEPDFDRVLDLPGAGPTPRPVEIGPAQTGFLDLLGLRIDELADGAAVADAAGTEEVLLVLLAGALTVEVTLPDPAGVQLDADGDWALHLPPGSVWTVRTLAPATIARAAARAAGPFATHAIAPYNGTLAFDGPQGRLRLHLGSLDRGPGPDPDLPHGLERFLHLAGPARVENHDLPPMHTLALSPGEATRIEGQGEFLALAAEGS